MVEEVGQLPLAVDDVASVADRVGQRARPAAEHADLADLNVEKKITLS